MRKILLLVGIFAVPLLWAPAEAQQTVQVCVHSTTTSSCAPVNSSNGFPVNVVAGSGGNGAASATGSAVPADADYQGLNVGGTLRGQTGTNTSGSTYAGDTNVVQSALPTNAAQESGGNLAAVAASTATIAGAVGSAIPAGTAAIGTLTGSTPYGLQATASTNATSVKGSPGVVKAMNLFNTTTTIYYLRTYNLSSAPTCSSATGFVRSWPIPPAAAAGGVGGVAVDLGAGGTTFSTGIAFCVTGGPSSTDNTNAASGVFINLDYQ